MSTTLKNGIIRIDMPGEPGKKLAVIIADDETLSETVRKYHPLVDRLRNGNGYLVDGSDRNIVLKEYVYVIGHSLKTKIGGYSPEDRDSFERAIEEKAPRDRPYISLAEAERIEEINDKVIRKLRNRAAGIGSQVNKMTSFSGLVGKDNPFGSISNGEKWRPRGYILQDNGKTHLLIPTESRDIYETAEGVDPTYGAISKRLALANCHPFTAPFGVGENGQPVDVTFESIAGAYYMLHTQKSMPEHGKLSRICGPELMEFRRSTDPKYRIRSNDVYNRNFWIAAILWYSIAGLDVKRPAWRRKNHGIDSPEKWVGYILSAAKKRDGNGFLPVAGYRCTREQVDLGAPGIFDAAAIVFARAYNDLINEFKGLDPTKYSEKIASDFESTGMFRKAVARDEHDNRDREKKARKHADVADKNAVCVGDMEVSAEVISIEEPGKDDESMSWKLNVPVPAASSSEPAAAPDEELGEAAWHPLYNPGLQSAPQMPLDNNGGVCIEPGIEVELFPDSTGHYALPMSEPDAVQTAEVTHDNPAQVEALFGDADKDGTESDDGAPDRV